MVEEVGVEMVEVASNAKGEEEVLVLSPKSAREKSPSNSISRWRDGGGREQEINGIKISKQFSLELIFIGDSSGEIIGEVGGAPECCKYVKKGKTQDVGSEEDCQE
ncbi:hypothetical protein Tco_0673533 [Tanacetum coccineum]